ncbi:TonB-dependent receptor [Paraglaciecola chathamensis]|uniref:TonB-dependent receptor n=1 Tax=Paraglaciecola chathamensis TaxID=368405 RepID=A0ABS0WGQ2_9ALTE|nr:TonB-dependent receptor [Paraglaciecola chathamensis]MBJ2137627.1 TonB-dependent receptor [Paraglaciecola chathamensis]
MKLKKLSLYFPLLALSALSLQAAAQEIANQEAEADENAGIETIMVTAQRKSESMQEAAIPLVAVDQKSLTRQGLESGQDLGKLSPSLGISAGGGPLTSIFIRGVGALTVNPLTDAAVAQNVDGVYLGRSSGAAGQGLYDLERVEILKGPQGTLYGRNATGGVVNYIPVKPQLRETSGYAQIELGDYSRVGFQGAYNAPIGDEAALRLSVNSLQRDGYSDDGTNDADSFSVRAQVLFEPTEDFNIRFAADYSENSAIGAGGDLIGTFSNDAGNLQEFFPSGIDAFTGPTDDAANAIRTSVLHTPSFAPYQPLDIDDLGQDISFTGFMAEVNYTIESGTLTVIPSYRESEQDYTFVGPGFAPAKTSEQNEQTSIEARFTTDLEGALNGILGVFYFDEEIQTSGVFAQNYASPIQNYENGGDSWAVFGQATYDVSDTFRMNLGLRYTEDSKYAEGISDTFVTFCGGAPFSGNFLTPPASFGNGCASGAMPAHPIISDRDEFIAYFVNEGLIAPDSVATVPGMGPPPFYNLTIPGGITPQIGSIVNVGEGFIQTELDYSETTYRIGVEYDVAEDSLLYATFETGYRAGGVDLSLAAPTYDPEYIDAFTFGSKNRFLDNTLQLNLEAFHWKYDGQQVTYFTTLEGASSFPIANGDATIQGLDVDVIWSIGGGTTISGNVQFLDSTYDSLTLVSDPGRGRFGCASTGVEDDLESYDCSGQSLLYSPDFGANLAVNHVIEIDEYNLSLTAQASHRSEQATNFLFVESTNTDSYVTLDFDATLASGNDSFDWTLSLFVRNATDEQYVANSNVNNRGLTYVVHNPPRTFGLRFRTEFY